MKKLTGSYQTSEQAKKMLDKKLNPKVSVIIPTCNRDESLSLAIRSVLNQTFKHFEIRVVADASTRSNPKQVINRFSDRRIYFISQTRAHSAAAARNIGIKCANGEFIAFLDDDDVWMPRKLEKQLNLINRKPAVGAVYTGGWIVNKRNKRIGLKTPSLRGNIFPNMLKRNNIGNCSMVLVRKECFERVGFFDENLPAFEDWDMWIRLAKHYQFDYVNEPLVQYTVDEKSISSRQHSRMQAAKLLFKKFSKDLNTHINHRKILAYWYYRFGRIYCESGNMRKGRKEFVKAMSKDPYNVIYSIKLSTSLLGLRIYTTSSSFMDFALPCARLWKR